MLTMPSPHYSTNAVVNCNCQCFLSHGSQRVKKYRVTAKGVMRQPTLLCERQHYDNVSVSSSTWRNYDCAGCRQRSNRTVSSPALSESSSALELHLPNNFSVMVLGAPAVGKSALINQFIFEHSVIETEDMTDSLIDDRNVSVCFDGEEADLNFLEKPDEQSHEEFIQHFDADAYVIVYSITDRISFCRAEIILNYLQEYAFIADKAVILVSNKSDLVRLRAVSTDEGKTMAKSYGCKFIETSHWLNHNIDELLVGLCSQIHLKQKKLKQQQKHDSIHLHKGSRRALNRSKTIVRDLFSKLVSKSKSCDNLHVL